MAQSSSGSQRDDVSLESLTDEPKSELRLVLLGGDCAYNNYLADIILRSDNRRETYNPKKGNFRAGSVDGRQVSVFVAPSYWMNHLASYWIFSNGVESIRREIQDCTSVTFPGPHAFLLVMRAGHTTGKEHLLLKAIACMFGAEALHYTMVVFVYGHEWENPRDALNNCCVKMCGSKYFILENSEENVKNFFRKVDRMAQRKKSRFFIQQSYEKLMKMCFEPWERAQVYKETQLKRELEELKTHLREEVLMADLDTLKQTERDLKEDLETSRHREKVLQEDLNKARRGPKNVRKELDVLRGSEAGRRKHVRHNSKETPPELPEDKNEPRDNLWMI